MKSGEMMFIVVGGFAVIVGMALWNGYLLSVLWGWFVVPLGVPSIGVAHAIGLALIAGLLKGIRETSEEKGALLRIASWLIGTLLALGIGYIVKGHMT